MKQKQRPLKLVWTILIAVALFVFTIMGVLADLNTDVLHYYKFDGDATDSVGSNDGSVNGATNNILYGKINEGYDYDGTNDAINFAYPLSGFGSQDYSVSFWVNRDQRLSYDQIFRLGNQSPTGTTGNRGANMGMGYYGSNNLWIWGYYSEIDTGYAMSDDTWYHVVLLANGTYAHIYVNGAHEFTTSGFYNDLDLVKTGATGLSIGGGGVGNPFDGFVDEFSIWERLLTGAEITELYNSGTGLQYPFSSPVSANFSITAKDLYDNSSINNFSADIDSTTYTTTNGTITTHILQNDTSTYNIFVYDAENSAGDYFNRTYSAVDVSTNLQAELFQSEITFTPREAWTNNALALNISINGTLYTDPARLKAGIYNVSVLSNGAYQQKDFEINISPLQNGTLNLEGVYTTLLTISVKNAYSGANLSNFSGNLSYGATTENFNVSDGYYTTGAISGVVLLGYAEAPGYSITAEQNFKNITPTGTAYNFNFSLYSTNSVNIFIRDSETNALILSNVSVTITGNESEEIYYTTTGSLFVENLTDGEYSFKFIDVEGNYSLSSYLVSVADLSTQTLTAYLTANAQQVIFTYIDSQTLQPLEGVSVSQSKLINASYVLIESKNTDITGRVQFNYLPTSKYRFTGAKENYTTKIFELDPVLFSSYNVKLDRVIKQDASVYAYAGVNVEYFPKVFNNSANNTLTFIIQSPGGSLSNYSVNISFDGNNAYAEGNNAYGENLNLELEIMGASLYDQVRLDFSYTTTTGNNHVFIYYLPILYADPVQDTFFYNAGETYGLGWFERVLVATLIILVAGGIVFLVAGGTPGLIIGLALMGYFSYIGFIPLWGVLIAFFVGLIMLSRSPGANYG